MSCPRFKAAKRLAVLGKTANCLAVLERIYLQLISISLRFIASKNSKAAKPQPYRVATWRP